MWGWKPYVPVARRRAEATRHQKEMARKGTALSPVVIAGRAIATSFWGRAWCENLESYSDYSNRLPRGRTYARNGSVIDLRVESGRVVAKVSGSTLYDIDVTVKPLAAERWSAVVERHAAQVSSVVELLKGCLPTALLESLADRSSGLFPSPRELSFSCSCPDWASMCKHVAAVLYGVGNRLDADPGLFFLLRGVDVAELAARGASVELGATGSDPSFGDDLGALFGIELAADAGSSAPAPVSAQVVKPARAARTAKAARSAKAAPVEAPARSAKSARPAKAAKSAKPVKAATPAKPVKAAKSAKAAKATKPVKPAKAKAKVAVPAKSVAAASPATPPIVSSTELRARGASPSTTSSWLRTGALVKTDRPGVYELTPDGAEKLRRLPAR